MRIYAGIDLHSNNIYLVLLREDDQVLYERRLPNDLEKILGELKPYQDDIEEMVVESTYNGYWLIDGLQEAGYSMKMVNPAAIPQYSGIKHTDDRSDAHWLARLSKLGLIPEGYICPKEIRATRDLLRRRAFLVQQRTANILSVESAFARNLAKSINGKTTKTLTPEQIQSHPFLEDTAFGIQCQVDIIQSMTKAIEAIEEKVKKKIKLTNFERFKNLQTIPGIGDILALTILLEVSEIDRFSSPKKYASYCRLVNTRRESNGKKKGENNRKNGNRYLAWAYMEAANFSIRHNPTIKKYYQRKMAKTCRVLALKTVAHKLACGTYFILRDGVSFDVNKLF